MELIVVGYGNMAKAIINGILRQTKEKLQISNITIVGRDPYKIESWLTDSIKQCRSEFVNNVTIKKMQDIKCNNKLVLLACKPSNLDVFSFSGKAHIVYSVLAGVSIQTLHTNINSNHYVIIMPNIGAYYGLSSNAVLWQQNAENSQTIKEVGKVIDLLVDNHNIKEAKQKQLAHIKDSIFNFVSSFGNCIFVSNEQEVLASIATNGSSPAILALVAQALINAGVQQGLKLDISQKLVQKTFEGIAQLLKDKSPQEIKDCVTSPGGTTAEALLHCDEHSVQGIITRACIKATQKAKNIESK